MTIRKEFLSTPYPFDHAEGNISLAHFLIKDILDKDDPGEILQGRPKPFSTIYRNCKPESLADSAKLRKWPKTALGLKPLPESPDDEDS